VRALALSVLTAAETRKRPNIRLAFVAPPELPPVDCDEGLLRQVVTNLVDNALKYSPGGGRIELRLEDGPEHVRISVHDEGLGIPASEQERIFDKFYRLDADMSRGVGGSGLGLHIARELVEQMGGTISVESVPGSGSTFTVVLPRVPAAS
jgi:two-component system, OmpR family, phosphate regulon sensor histidine kinase PhoR